MKAGGGLILYREPMGTFQSNGEVPSKMLRNGRGENDGIQRQFFRLHPQRALCAAGGLDADKECIGEYFHDYLQDLSCK